MRLLLLSAVHVREPSVTCHAIGPNWFVKSSSIVYTCTANSSGSLSGTSWCLRTSRLYDSLAG